ncbi:hypothetical protein ACWGH8_26360 [Nonomuraea muscovyensis]
MRGFRCTVAISRSPGASVTSRSRSTNSAASNVTADACELRARRRRCDGVVPGGFALDDFLIDTTAPHVPSTTAAPPSRPAASPPRAATSWTPFCA